MTGKETRGCEYIKAVQKRLLSGYGDIQFLLAPMMLQEKGKQDNFSNFWIQPLCSIIVKYVFKT